TIFFVDVEGGQATLIVTPAGQSLLIDTGYARSGRDPDRIMAAVREANLDHIDYLLITHFHPDHVGGVPELAKRIPIRTFIDYGEPMGTDRMTAGGFKAYEPIRSEHPHLVPKPGDRLPLRGIEADVISAAGMVLSRPLRKAAERTRLPAQAWRIKKRTAPRISGRSACGSSSAHSGSSTLGI